jgi:quercetin dioxygenase-like cupin family protein
VAPQPQLTPTLAALRDHLSAIERPDGPAMAAALAAAQVTFDDVRGFVRFDDDSYVRALIYSNDRLELRLHCWRPGQSSSLHGHGASACAFKILRGTATETVLGDRDRVWAPGSVVVENAPRLHQVMNAGRDPLLTLHAYSPPLPVDAPSSRRGRQVVIVGGGFAGAAVAYHLLREMDGDGRIHLVEMGPWLGRGIAYGVESEVFRLNVPASRMSIDPETPDDFVKFAGSEAAPHSFLSRALYARYVTARFGGVVKSSRAKLRLWRDEAVAVTRDAVVLRGGATLPAEAVVLATGIVPRVKHGAVWHPRVIDAWDECALATLPKAGRLLLLGSGLSALDVLAFLDAQGFAGEVTLISPRGLLPLPHEPEFQGTPPLPAPEVDRAPTSIRPLVRWSATRSRPPSRVACPGSARSTVSVPTWCASIARCRRRTGAASSATSVPTGTCFGTGHPRTRSCASVPGRAMAGCGGSPGA